jgi:hypothetical protein
VKDQEKEEEKAAKEEETAAKEQEKEEEKTEKEAEGEPSGGVGPAGETGEGGE